MADKISKAFHVLKEGGAKALIKKIKNSSSSKKLLREDEARYSDFIKRNSPSKEELLMQKNTDFLRAPLISICVPLYRTDKEGLKMMIDSVLSQTYSNFELCLADGSEFPVDRREDTADGSEFPADETDYHTDVSCEVYDETDYHADVSCEVSDGSDVPADKSENTSLEEIVKSYQAKDKRIKYIKLEKNLGISGNTNAAISLATGDFVGFLDHDDELSPDALFEVVKAYNEDSETDMFYSDQDIVSPDGGHFSEPFFKPDFSPVYLESNNYFSHFLVVSRRLLDTIADYDIDNPIYFRKEFDGSQDYDFTFRCSEKAENVCHIKKVLYHWRTSENSTAADPKNKKYAFLAGRKAIESHFKRTGIEANVYYTDIYGLYRVIRQVRPEPFVSIAIRVSDHGNLYKCIKSIKENIIYKNIEIILIKSKDIDLKNYSDLKQMECDPSLSNEDCFESAKKISKGSYILFMSDSMVIPPQDSRFLTEFPYASEEIRKYDEKDFDIIYEMLGFFTEENVARVGTKIIREDRTVESSENVVVPDRMEGEMTWFSFDGIDEHALGFHNLGMAPHEVNKVSDDFFMAKNKEEPDEKIKSVVLDNSVYVIKITD